MLEENQINECLRDLYNEVQRQRIAAINTLGGIGDELCLKELREQLKVINTEHQALIVAVGKLKKKLGII